MLLDLDTLAEGHEFFSLGGTSISPDDRLLAYATDVVGDERYTVQVKDLATGELLPDRLTGVLGGATWGATADHFYYSTIDESWRPDKIWRHRLGTEQAADELVFHEPDGRFWVGVGRTRSRRYIVIATSARNSSEYHVLDATDPTAEPWCFAEREEGVEYSLEHAVIAGADTFLVLHNATGPEFELATAPPRPTAASRLGPAAGPRPRRTTGGRRRLRDRTSSSSSAATACPGSGSSTSDRTGWPTTGWSSSPASSRRRAPAATRPSTSRRSASA